MFSTSSPHTADTTNLWFGYPLIILGIVFLIGSAVAWIQRSRFLATAQEAQGTIIGYESVDSVHHESTDGSSVNDRTVINVGYRPIIEFTAQDGQKYHFTSRTTATENTNVHPTVLYTPNNPNSAQQKGFFAQTGWVIIITVLGLLLVIGGTAIVLKLI